MRGVSRCGITELRGHSAVNFDRYHHIALTEVVPICTHTGSQHTNSCACLTQSNESVIKHSDVCHFCLS